MAWTWKQFLAVMVRPDGSVLVAGYAGNGIWKNDPDSSHVHDHGPLPCGLYFIGDPIDHPRVGLYALPLTPDPGNMMFGRAGFFCHGENKKHPGESSDGCPVVARWAREAIASSRDRDLQVIP